MAQALKEIYNTSFVGLLSQELVNIYPNFDTNYFKTIIFDNQWQSKELKARIRHIAESLHSCLPNKYPKALVILKPVATKFAGLECMIFPDFVELYGLDDYQESIIALEHFTKYSSSEFAVRPFILKYGKKMMQQMELWAKSDNYHVRRLASEGCRPKLPWAMALSKFQQDPTPILPILEQLKNDASKYVQKSVANNLNDISKDNPKITINIAKKWLGNSSETDWIVKHAARSLLKQGEPEILKLFGLLEPKHITVHDFIVTSKIAIGQTLEFTFTLKTKQQQLGKLRIEYIIEFVRLNNKYTKKIFKISEANYSKPRKDIIKHHSFKLLSTRKYYPGKHSLTIVVNGHKLKKLDFKLTLN